jgi:hypothetical protein
MFIAQPFKISTTGMIIALVTLSMSFFVKVMSLKELMVACYCVDATHSMEKNGIASF